MNKNIRNFCIIAHIDHGKSTLADRMLELTETISKNKMKDQVLDRMDLERERGITIKLQPVRMKFSYENEDFELNLIDTPGHVDFSYEVSRTLAAVEGAILLVDATQGIQAQTLANLYQAIDQNLEIIPVINKIDLPNADVDKTKKEVAQLLSISEDEILAVSAKTGQNVSSIFPEIIKRVPAPRIENEKALKALIFDSVYDKYRGVVAYVRVVEGKIEKNDIIKFFANKTVDKALEVGYFAPDYMPKENLNSGEIGYIVTGLKNIDLCKVGDTITLEKEEIEPLPGYKGVKPMVFAGIYTKDGNVGKLRDALEKLSLNDSALSMQPENSMAFGSGFRCGFLGLLHLEIIKERLTREYNLDLIITSPKVDYKERMEGGKIVYAEPWVRLEIVTPTIYIGQIMDLTISIRGIYKSTEYIGDRAILHFEAPLANIITNYYDKLKSVSAGYASLNYDFCEFREGSLLKMDVLVAGEKFDTLSQIVHKDELMSAGKRITSKLKEHLPKQMFKVTIQAAVGGKIIAREDISPLKKDVAGYLYGGDISRKKKLWAKQAKGKKKMQKLGRMDIPTDVFIKILK